MKEKKKKNKAFMIKDPLITLLYMENMLFLNF